MSKICFLLFTICISSGTLSQNFTEPLSIETNSDAVISFNNMDDSWQFLQFKRSGVRKTWMGLSSGNDFWINKEGGGSILFNGGNIGIGTTNPDARLDVNGDIKLNGGTQNFKISNLTGAETGYGDFVNYGGIAINGNDGGNRQMFMFSDGSINHNIFTVASSTDAGVTWNPRFIVKQSGGVGIGTTSLGSHKLAVEGSIGAREIKVEASGWSDFVFENDYDLRTLEEVEQYINYNGHLPEIPSEAEVSENGINLGEMDAKLLQKIEELTLYMIEVNQQVQELKSENQELKKEVSTLKNK